MCPQLVVKTTYIDTLMKLLLTYAILIYFVAEQLVAQLSSQEAVNNGRDKPGRNERRSSLISAIHRPLGGVDV